MLKFKLLDKYTYECPVYNNDFAILRGEKPNGLLNTRIARAVIDRNMDHIEEVIASPEELLLKFAEGHASHDLSFLNDLKDPGAQQSRHWKIPVYFTDNGDWKEIVTMCKMPREEYIDKFLSCNFTLSMTGFLPGFLYLEGLPENLQCPRKKNPSSRVPQRALAVGGPYAGIYNYPSPGGWHIIGDVQADMINEDTIPPLPIQPGDKIEFVRCGKPTVSLPSLDEYNDKN